MNKSLPNMIKLCLLVIAILSMVVFWQQIVIHRKQATIARLVDRYNDAHMDSGSFEQQLVELRNSIGDAQLFQRELVKIIKDIDKRYPIALLANNNFEYTFGEKLHNNQSNDAIFTLASSEQQLRIQAASLLGQAAHIREVLNNTPSMFPVNGGAISSRFGKRVDPFTHRTKYHHGLDIASKEGTIVVASADGRVTEAGYHVDLGNWVEIEHKDDFSTVYGHLSEILVTKGRMVSRGQPLGKMGKTGKRCKGAHLHFELKKNGHKQNPLPYLISPAA